MATKVTYISTTLPSDEQNAAFDAAVAEVRRRSARTAGDRWRAPRRRGDVHGAEPGRSRRDARHVRRGVGERRGRRRGRGRAAAHDWSATRTRERARILQRAADLIRERVMFLGAVVALEVGKNRVESVGEVEEGADLISYYCRPSRRAPRLPNRPGVADRRGPQHKRAAAVRRVRRDLAVQLPVGAVRRPDRRCAGGGQHGGLQAAPRRPVVGRAAGRVLHEAGVPARRAEPRHRRARVGKALVAAAGVDGIAFTGSYDVGREIYRAFAVGGLPRPCITEMGGKNPTIVTATADLEKAANGILRSAFGASGQKCSACSRVLVEAIVHDALVERLAEGAERGRSADSVAADCRLGPVNNEEARTRSTAGPPPTRAATAGSWPAPRCSPTARSRTAGSSRRRSWPTCRPATGLSATSCSCRSSSVERAADLDAAIAAANDQTLGLTAGLFSEDQAEKQRVPRPHRGRRRVHQPRRGLDHRRLAGLPDVRRLEGLGSTGKAAFGPHYVQLFMREQSRTILP